MLASWQNRNIMFHSSRYQFIYFVPELSNYENNLEMLVFCVIMVMRFTSFLASQAYKCLYAKRLAELGMLAEAVHYVEVIAGAILQQPTSYSASFVKEVYDLGDQLKYYDPLYRSREGETVELADPSWLRGLHSVVYNYSVSTIYVKQQFNFLISVFYTVTLSNFK
jgi:hypothetical protein